MKFTSFYDTLKEKEGYKSDLPSLTMQEFKDECDINKILAGFNNTGILPPSQQLDSTRVPEFINLADMPSSPQEYFEIYQEAMQSFDSLPISIRERFNHDKMAFIEYVANPQNSDELVRLGLAYSRHSGNDDRHDNNALKQNNDADSSSGNKMLEKPDNS